MSIATIAPSDVYSTATIATSKVGQLYVDTNGNRYRYVKNAAVALIAAHTIQEPAEDTQFVSMAVPAAVAIGATAITVTNGTTTVTANMFDNGRLTISTSTGIGQSFNIVSHTTGVSGASIVFNIDRPLVTALTTSSKVSTRVNPYNGIIETPVTTQTGIAVGVALVAVAAGSYGFIQSGGDAPVLFDTGTNTANDQLSIAPSVAVAGSVRVAPSAVGTEIIGYSHQVVSVDSTVSLAHLIID